MDADTNLTAHTADIVAAYVSNNQVRTEDLPNLINTVRSALQSPAAEGVPLSMRRRPECSPCPLPHLV